MSIKSDKWIRRMSLDNDMISPFEDGQISEEGNYKDGKKDGKWTYYNEDGSIEKVENYKDGVRID